MAHSGRVRHRDRAAVRREVDEAAAPPSAFRITDRQREEIADCLRDIDDARAELERQHSAANRLIVRRLRDAADRVYDLLNRLDPADG